MEGRKMKRIRTRDDLTVHLTDRNGKVRSTLQFHELSLSQELASAFKSAFDSLTQPLTFESRMHVWRHIKLFSKYLELSKQNLDVKIRGDILLTFRYWLAGTPSTDGYKRTVLNQISSIVVWCSRNEHDLIHGDLRTDMSRFHVVKKKREKSKLGEKEIKSILDAAYREIDEIVTRITSAWSDTPNASRSRDYSLAHELASLQSDKSPFPKQKELSGLHPSLHRKVDKSGGLKFLSALLYPSPSDIFPFYLAILCQCSANPMAMRQLKVDCVRPHPLRPDRSRIVWSKNRSGYEQKADFSNQRSRSAPRLVENLKELTARMRPYASESDKQLLFIGCWSGRVQVPSWQTLHCYLDDFIERHNLPKFDFKDLRIAGAELHRTTTGTILGAARRLNHREASTTSIYISDEVARDRNDIIVAEAQNELLSVIKSGTISAKPIVPTKRSENGAETVFGFKCLDPYAGIAAGSSQGALCTKFSACATCPGSIIPLDDVNIVAKLMKAMEQLVDAKKRATNQGWLERYMILYEPTRQIIERDLLPRVAEHVKEKAIAISSMHVMLTLE
jgi:hypothetical protein